MSRHYELKDLYQDGMMIYARCRARYPQFNDIDPTPKERRHFMALVMVSFTRHIHSRAKKRSPDELGDDISTTWLNSSVPADAPLLTLLTQAPSELKELFVLFATDTSEYLKLGRVRETTNQHVGRLLDKSGDLDYRDLVLSYVRDR